MRASELGGGGYGGGGDGGGTGGGEGGGGEGVGDIIMEGSSGRLAVRSFPEGSRL